MKVKIFLLILSFVVVGCATNAQRFEPKKLDYSKTGVFF